MGNTDFDRKPGQAEQGEHTRQQQGSGGGEQRTDEVSHNEQPNSPGESRPNQSVKQPGRANEQHER